MNSFKKEKKPLKEREWRNTLDLSPIPARLVAVSQIS